MSDIPAGLRSSRPTLCIDGNPEPAFAAGLQSLSIAEDITGMARCEAVFAAWGLKSGEAGFVHHDRAKLEFGKPFEVKLGDGLLFSGRIMAIEGRFPRGAAPEIALLAEDRFQDLRMTRRTRTFADMSDADVMSQIAGDHGLSPQIDVTGPTHKVLAQVNQSDLAFLRERARLIGAELWLEGWNLHAAHRASRRGKPLQLTRGGDLHDFIVLADLAHQRTAVTVRGWDVSGKSPIDPEVGESLVSGELDGGEGGASVLRAAIGERKESLTHMVPLGTEEARGLAEAFFRTTARRFVTGRGTAVTQAGLRAGATVDLQGLGPLFSGKYYATEIRHLFDSARGLRTEFSSERAAIGRAA